MKKIAFVSFIIFGALFIMNLYAEHPVYTWFKIKYQCQMEREYGNNFQTFMTTIKVKKNLGQKQAEEEAIKEGYKRGCQQGTVHIITTEEERN